MELFDSSDSIDDLLIKSTVTLAGGRLRSARKQEKKVENVCATGGNANCLCIQLFRQRLSHKSVKAYATMPIGIMGRKSSALIG